MAVCAARGRKQGGGVQQRTGQDPKCLVARSADQDGGVAGNPEPGQQQVVGENDGPLGILDHRASAQAGHERVQPRPRLPQGLRPLFGLGDVA